MRWALAVLVAIFCAGSACAHPVPRRVANDCAFVSAAASFACVAPETLKGMISQNGDDTFCVTFGTGDNSYAVDDIVCPIGDGHVYSAANGMWLAVLEKAYGQYCYESAMFFESLKAGWTPYTFIDRPDGLSSNEGVAAVTGDVAVETDIDFNDISSLDNIRSALTAALCSGTKYAVTAGTGSSEYGFDEAYIHQRGLTAEHVYSVVGYDPLTDIVTLRDPVRYVSQTLIGPNGAGEEVSPALTGDAESSTDKGLFTMPLANFYHIFWGVACQSATPYPFNDPPW